MRNRIVFHIFLLLAAITLPLTGGCANLGLISTEQEIAMGEDAAPQFEEEFGGKVPDDRLQAYVRGIGMRLANASDREMPYDYTLVASDIPNAFALPGGKIFVTAGLMNIMSNERQLAAVLGHETAHVARKHNVQQMERQLSTEILAEIIGAAVGGTAGGAAQAGAQVTGAMITMKYGRGHEHEADEVGLEFMVRAGYNPYGMVELLEALGSISEEQRSAIGGIFRSHPYTDDRIQDTRENIEEGYSNFSAGEPDPGAAKFRDMRQLMIKTLGW